MTASTLSHPKGKAITTYHLWKPNLTYLNCDGQGLRWPGPNSSKAIKTSGRQRFEGIERLIVRPGTSVNGSSKRISIYNFSKLCKEVFLKCLLPSSRYEVWTFPGCEPLSPCSSIFRCHRTKQRYQLKHKPHVLTTDIPLLN